ncbi:hypothetical protein HYN48_01095 [Flavobacterium magnum]|uniref:PKD/Chitinase domain-containing protein n=1 Tax=Flavobacterium magnum TaxID=2162713 RepID=A0A2S0RB63_9FLAO|nr:GEVED domain-containing protein [Flavobacterium magnum]AWA28795.1 hypothetical protein HYN48_01095 [Flavobacterium magnum]
MLKNYISSEAGVVAGTYRSVLNKIAATLSLVLFCVLGASAQVDVTASGGTSSANYTTLKGAFDAINAGTHTGTITIGISGNTTETATAVLNASGSGAASYASIAISPTGGAARTISGAIAGGSPMIDLSGADNVTFDGLNSGGNALTLSNTTASATSGTSTIRFIGGATNNTITKCSVLGSFSAAVGTNGGNIFFSTDAVTANGNDNNTVSFCDIGPAGTNLPSKGIYINGSTTTTALNNSGNTFNGNNIFDYFGAAVSSAGIYIAGGATDTNITNNKFYQTAARTQTTGAQHSAVWIANTSGNNYQVTGNIIGFANAGGTGTYSFVGVSSSSIFVPIHCLAGTTTASSVSSNTISNISVSGAISGTTSTGPFRAIYVTGLTNVNSNSIGSQSATGAISVTSSSASTSNTYGIYNNSSSATTISNNQIGGINVANSTSGTVTFTGIFINTSSSVTATCSNNSIGGSVANSIAVSGTSTACQVVGINIGLPITTLTSNTIRNLTNNAGTGTTTTSSVIGVLFNASTVSTIGSNTIFNLSSTLAGAATVNGIYSGTPASGTVFEKNLIYGLDAANAAASVNGIYVGGGTATYRNNMIRLGVSGSSATVGMAINGVNEQAGTDNFYHNSIFIGGAPTGGASNSFAFQSIVTANTRAYQNNIFVNKRSNSGSTGKHYAIRVGGTAANPAGLTSNGNILFANGTNGFTGLFNAVDQSTIANWRTATGQDANSYAEDTPFKDALSSPPNLHLDSSTATFTEGLGVTLASVTDDFDGEARSGLTPVDIGADASNATGPAVVKINSVAASPTGNQCTAASRTITANITAGAGAITSVTLNYSFNGTAQTPITMTGGTLTAGTTSNFTATIPAATPANASVVWSVTAVDAVVTRTVVGTGYADAPLLGATASASASVTTLCNGTPTILSAAISKPGTATLGAGATTASSYDGIFYHLFGGNKSQFLVRASELSALGLSAGNITSIGITMNTVTAQAYSNFAINIAPTAQTAMTTTLVSAGLTQVYSASSYTPTTGDNTFTFSTPFVWDGTSNIVVQFCWSNNNTGGTSNFAKVDATPFVSCGYYRVDSTVASTLCGVTAASGTTSNRPKMIFGGNVSPTISSYSWSDGSTVVGTTNNLSVSPSATTTYTATLSLSGCPVTTNSVTVTVNPAPTAPTATNSSQCGLDIPTASVADPNGFTTPIIKWYATNVATTPLQATTSNTYGTAISATTTFYVSVVNPTTGCESTRTPVTVTVSTPDPITVTPGATATICAGQTISLGASSINAGYVYTWTASPATGSGVSGTLTGASQSVTPTLPGTYVYSVLGDDGICATTKTVTVTVGPLPAITTAVAASPTICEGSSTALTATSIGIGAGVGTIGTQTTTIGGDNGNPYRSGNGTGNQIKTQLLYRASELTAAGYVAGNITSLGFTVTGADTGVVSNLTIKMAATSATALTTTYETPTFTTVFTQASFTPALGVNTHTFSTPFVWDGTSNIIVETCQTNNITGTTTVACSTPAFAGNTHSASSTTACSATTGTAVANRPIVTLGGQKTTDITASYTWSWNPGNLSGASVSVSPLTTTAYTVRATNNTTGCFAEQVVNVTVNPKPLVLTATNSSQCGFQMPTASVADPNGFTTPTIKWYADNVTATALQSSTSNTYNTAISATTTLYVSVTNPTTGCESNRTPVTVTVSNPDPITVTPGATANACAGTAVSLGASSVNTSYVYSWSASPQTGSGITGTVNGASQTVTPTIAGTYVYTVIGTDGVCTATSTVTVTVGALPLISSVTGPSAAACPGTASVLTAKSVPATAGTAAIGTQSTTEFGGGVYRNGFGTGDFKHQLIYTAAELNAAGLVGGNITSISFNVTSAGSGSANNYTIRMANVASTPPLTTSFLSPAGFTTCYTASTYTAVAGVNTHTFTTPFNWDGTSNVLVDICYNISTTGSSSTLAATTPSVVSNNNLLGSAGACAATTGATTYANRPLATFAGQVGSDVTSSYTWTWNPGNLSGSSVSVSPTTTTLYTVRATNTTTGCFSEQTITVNVNPAPAAPVVVSNTSQCGTQVPGASVSDPNGFTTPVIRWYNVATGGTPLQATTSLSYDSAISVTTTFYVAVVNPTTGCEGARTPLTITVATPDALSVTAPSSVCAGGSFNISSSYTPSFNNFTQFTLSAAPATGSGVTGNVALTANASGSDAYLVTPTAAGTYVYTISAYDPVQGCTSVQTKTITVNALPVLTVSATPATICAGSATTLLATTPTITAGLASSIGTDVTTTSTNAITPFTSNYEGQHVQYIVRASELTASGLKAGNLTSLAFNVTASGVGTFAQSGYTVKIANTADTAFSGNFATPSGSFTTVYGPISKPAPAVGIHTLTFTTPFNWDGSSNIVVDICHDNDSVADTCASCFSGNSTVAYSTTAYNSVYGKYADNNSLCGTNNGTAITTFTNRPNMVFGGQVLGQGAGSLTYSWSDGVSEVSTSNTFSASPTTTTVYTVTATDPVTSCAKSQNVTVNVNPAPNAPTVVNGGNCGPGVVTTATVSNTNGFATPTYKWYSASTGGTALQSSTATNYTTSISATTTLYVSVVNPATGCESPRSAIVLTIDTTPSATINYDNSPYCNTLTSAPVTRTGTAGGTYTADVALSLNPTTGEVNPSLSTPGLYQVTYTMDGGSCGMKTATTFITIGQNPSSGFTYGSSVYCSSSLTATPVITGTAGTFTAVPAGLSINPSTGVIDLAASLEGTYNVTNTVTGAGCTTSTTTVAVTVNKAVAITAQPQGVSILPADNTSFSVTATGTGISSYVWEVNNGSGWSTVTDGGVYSGATTSTLALTNVTSGMNQYQYRVTVSGTAPCAPVTSDPAILTVTTISISAQPQSQTICSNTGVTFSVSTAGGTPSSYQWQYRVNSAGTFADIPSATASSYSIPSGLTSANTGNQYQVVINGGSLVSNVATLTVNDVVAINSNPSTQTVCSSASSVTFTVGATGTGLTYQWEVSTDNGANWTPVSAATSASYTINTPAVSLTGSQYRAVVSGLAPCSAQTSAPATLTVIQSVAITAQPSNQAICASATANFSVTATGAGLAYQWIANNGSDIVLTDGTLSGATISGATTNALSITSPASLSGYTFRVQVSGTAPCTPLTSNTVSLYVVSGGTIAVGPSGTYNNLTSAIAALVTCGITQPTFLELNSGYDASTETYPINLPAITGASATNTITIREANGVTGKVISSANPVATFSLNGGNYWTIDGRSGGNGTTKDLQISNTNTTGAAIQFINDASNNIVRYADVRGVNTSTTSGVVLFSTTTATTGNDNNTIANCDIRDGATTPAIGIYSAGTAAKTNDNNTISNNNIFNFFSAASATRGISVASNSEAWTISGNKLYQTATRLYTTANTHHGINVAAGAGYTITGNTIGFANAAGTGTMSLVGNSVALTGTFPSAYTTTGTPNATRFIGINAAFTAAGTVSSIQNNTVGGIALYTSSGATTTNGILCGINVTSGNANIGTVTGNTIGATTGTGSLYAATTTTQGAVVGIYATSANTVSIQNNTIGAIDASGTTASLTGSITGIDVAGAGVITVSNNIVGNATANNLRAGAFFNGTNLTNAGALTFTTSGASLIDAIRSSATGSSTTISTNTVRNVTAYGTGGSAINGINNSGATTLLTAASNTISDISNAGTGAFTGMTVGSPATANVTSNTVNTLSRTGAGTFYGIQYGTPTTITIDGNTVSNLSNNAAGSTSGFYGLYSVGTPQNETITNNNVFNLSTTATGAQTMVGWYQLTSNTGTKVCTGNNFYNFTAPASSTVIMYGIRNGYGANVTVSRNTIYGFSGGITQFGIFSNPGVAGTANIFRNKIYDLSTGNTGAAQIIGLAMASTTASANTNAYNNLIGDLRTPAASNADAIRGISVSATAATANFNVYNNTVYLNASSTGAAFGTSGIYHAASSTATTAKLDLQNNIVINTSTPGTTGVVTALRRSAVATLGNFATTSNRNMYFAGTPAANRTILFDGTNAYQDYSTYYAAVGTTREANSFVDAAFSAATFFTSTTGNSSTYLKPNDAINTLAESGGANLSAFFTVDYNGVTRGTQYDMGAWEFAGSSPAPAVTLNSVSPALTTQCSATPRTVSVDVTTPSGTITAVTITYNNGSATGPVAMTNTSGSIWSYTIPAASPANSIVIWSVTATNSSALSTTFSGTSYQDAPNTGITSVASATATTICAGSPTTLDGALSGGSPTYTAPPAVTNPTTDEDMGNVTITQGATTILNNTSARNSLVGTIGTATGTAGSYANYTAFGPYTLNGGLTYNFSMTSVQDTSPFAHSMAIYIDYNRNGSFADAGEAVYTSAATTTGAHTETGSFVVPAGVNPGTARMRIIVTEGASGITGPTMTVGWGEYEEYAVNLVPSATYSWSDGTTVVGTTKSLTVNPTVTTTYTLTTSINGCPVVSNGVTVTVNPTSVAGTISGATSVCSGTNSTTLTLNGNTGTIQWQSSTDNTVFANISGATGSTYTAQNIAATTYYRAVVTSGLCSAATSASAAVTVIPQVNGGTLSNQTACYNSTPDDIVLSGSVGSVVKWQKSSDLAFTSPQDIANTTTTLTGAQVGNITATTYVRAVVQSGSCGTTNSAVATITPGNQTTWTVAGGWSNGAPTSTSAATINGNFTAVADLNACSLTIQSGTVSFPGGFDAYVSGKVSVNGGTITFEDGSDLVQTRNDANTGNIKYKRTANLIRQDYVYWSSPVSGQLLQPFSPNTLNTRFYTLDESSNGFSQIASPSTTSFDAAKGYMIRAANNHPAVLTPWTGTFTGTPRNGEYTIPVTVNGQGYNMIGNPYPSTVDADLFLAEPGNAGTLYFWTHISQAAASGANYASYNTFGGTAAQSGGSAPTGAIRGGQGFILLKSSASTARFTNAMRTAEGGAFYRNAQTAEKHRMWFNLNTPGHAMNQILVGYAEGATMGEDIAMDGKSIEGGSSISTLIGSDNYVIQARSLPFVDTDVVPMGFTAATAGTYIIELDHVDGLFSGDQNIYLKDNLLGVTHNIKQGAYSFASAEGTFANRFEVVYQSSPLGVDTPTFDANSVVVYKNQGMLHINSGKIVMSGVKIFDVRGRLIYERGAINASETVLNDLRAEEQVLLVQITSVDNEVVTKKVAY